MAGKIDGIYSLKLKASKMYRDFNASYNKHVVSCREGINHKIQKNTIETKNLKIMVTDFVAFKW